MKKIAFLFSVFVALNLFGSPTLCVKLLTGAHSSSIFGQGKTNSAEEAKQLISRLTDEIAAPQSTLVQQLKAHMTRDSLIAWTYEGERPIDELVRLIEGDQYQAKDNLRGKKCKRDFWGAGCAFTGMLLAAGNLVLGNESQSVFNQLYLATAFIGVGGVVYHSFGLNPIEKQLGVTTAFLQSLKDSYPIIHYQQIVQISDDTPGFNNLPPVLDEPHFTKQRYLQIDIIVQKRDGKTPLLHIIGSTYLNNSSNPFYPIW